jgi:pimeloyl-ACP methyl ester carboxylesterase
MALSITTTAAPRGEMIEIGGGRRLRVVAMGERGAGPTVVLEAGSFGSAADWAAVQDRLAPAMRCIAYDRAGLGYSDPGPEPRDSAAISLDLHALLHALDEPAPYILVAHSMAAVHVQVFALRWPHETAGIVMVDAIPPEALTRKPVIEVVKGFARAAVLARTGAMLKLTSLASPLFGDAIGLIGPAKLEKQRAFASAAHNHWATEEVQRWLSSAEQARALGALDRELPLATVTAGRSQAWWKAMQAEPAHRSRSGYAENVIGAGHATLLGPKHADAVVRGVTYVMKAAVAQRR